MKMPIILLLIISTVSIPTYSYADNKKEAYEIGLKAIQEMDSDNIAVSIKLLEQAKALDPENVDYPYEIAYAHYLTNDYKETIKILSELVKNPKANDRVHQMLGNAYDMNGNSKKAIEVYDNALSIFPKSGLLHLERGIMELKKEEYNNAINYFEKGIRADPMFPSNYYRVAQLYLGSTEKVWGMIYGEIFLNLERNSKRTAEISKMLYDTYKSQIQFSSASSISINFSKNSTIRISTNSDLGKLKLPFELIVYEPTISISLIGESKIDLDSLHRIRTRFLELYFKSGFEKEYPNILFDYQKRVNEAGHLEAYNHWILLMGDENGFTDWNNTNNEKWSAFITWFGNNPLTLDDKNKFYRYQY
jgi:tetratricopeptide (TPR) repeat protein